MLFASLFIPKFYLQAALRDHVLRASETDSPNELNCSPPATQSTSQGPAQTGAPTTATPSENVSPSKDSPHAPSLRGLPFEKPAALIDEREKKPVILELNRAAESADVVAGMTPSQALARCLDLLILPRALNQERVVREILLQQAFTLSPYVEETAAGLCTVQFFDRRDRTS